MIVYLPNHALQGSEIPFYMVWDRSEVFSSILVEYPECFEINELYNVSNGNFNILNNTLSLKTVDVNGYLGIKFSSKLSDPIVETNINVIVYKDNEIFQTEKKLIKLFRPDINLVKIPKRISLVNKNGKIQVSDKIQIENNGEGTAIIQLECLPDSEFKLERIMEVEKFKKNFWKDMKNKIKELKLIYPEYEWLFDEYIEIGENPLFLTKDGLERTKKVYEELLEVLLSNEDLLKEFSNAFLTAYLKNISLITEVGSFLQYLKSVYESYIIFINPSDTIKVNKNPKKLKAIFHVTDLALNEYEPFKLNAIEITANEEIELPIYLLFKFNQKLGGEKE